MQARGTVRNSGCTNCQELVSLPVVDFGEKKPSAYQTVGLL